jgi:hypothetical protein
VDVCSYEETQETLALLKTLRTEPEGLRPTRPVPSMRQSRSCGRFAPTTAPTPTFFWTMWAKKANAPCAACATFTPEARWPAASPLTLSWTAPARMRPSLRRWAAGIGSGLHRGVLLGLPPRQIHLKISMPRPCDSFLCKGWAASTELNQPSFPKRNNGLRTEFSGRCRWTVGIGLRPSRCRECQSLSGEPSARPYLGSWARCPRPQSPHVTNNSNNLFA